MLTTVEAAEYLKERGVKTALGTPYTPKVLQQYCRRGLFPNAVRPTNPQRGYWLIPESDLEAFVPPKRGRPPAPPAPQGNDDKE